MRTFDLFVVELERLVDDTITTDSGLELYIDTRFNEFENRITEGPVVAVPFKYETGVKPGDTLYFHHLVVINEGQPLTGDDNHYLVSVGYIKESVLLFINNNSSLIWRCPIPKIIECSLFFTK